MNAVKTKLQEEIEKAVADGYSVFLSGFAKGADLLFAELVMKQKEQNPHLFLVAAIPYNRRLKSSDPLFRKCLSGCNAIKVLQKEYGSECYRNRNRYMVNLSSRVIAVYDGREKGGTLFTMRYAHTMGREIREIRI